ncbi:MAG: ice-binding family protein [Eubacteriales bacterium]
MKFLNKKHFMTFLVSILLITTIALPITLLAADSPEPVDLLSTSSFAVLAGSTITNTGSTTISGDAGGNIGLYPGTSFTGQTDVSITGTVHINDGVAEQAQNDLITVYNDAAGRTPTTIVSAALGDGQTLTPGVYASTTSIQINGELILDAEGNPDAFFVFQAGTTLTTASYSKITLINGARYCRIFWQVGSSATLGTNSEFVGHIFASESITVTTDAFIQGQLLAINGAVTLDTNTIINGLCSVQTGSLTVTKTLSAPAGFDMSKQFDFTLRDAANAIVGTATIGNDGSAAFDNLELGTYTITESDAVVADYNLDVTVSGAASSNGGTLTVAAGSQTVAFTNTYIEQNPVQTGSLTVTKTLSAPAGFDMSKQFDFTLRDAANAVVGTATIGNDGSATFDNLESGTYTITESDAAVADYNLDVTVSGTASTNGGSLTVAAGSQTVAFTNTYIEQSPVQTGSLIVTKTLSAPAGFDMSKQFTFTLRNAANAVVGTATIGNGGSAAFDNLEPGTYTVTESDAAVADYSWAVTVSGAASTNGGSLTVAAGSQTVAFTNTYIEQSPVQTGSLIVTKTLSAPAGFDMSKQFTFTLRNAANTVVGTATIGNGGSAAFDNLEPGTYTVTESDAAVADYSWAVTVSGAASTNGGTLTVATGSQTVAFTNTYIKLIPIQTGSLTVTKTLSAPAGFDMSKQFTFTLRNAANTVVGTATFGNGGSAAFDNLEVGTYTITESDAPVADYIWDVTVSGAASTNGGILTVAAGSQTVAFTNTYVKPTPVQTGSLTVTKTLSAPDGFYMDKLFVFTLRNAANAVVGTATIRNGESATFNSLEPGSYTITESGAAVEDYIWNVTVSGAASSNGGTLTVAVGSQTIAFTNTYIKQSSVQTGSLTVTKTLSAPAGFDMSKQFTFTLRNAANAVVGSATVGNGESAAFNSLELGIYTITESGAAVENYIWNVTVSGAASSNGGTLTVAAGSQTVAFTNTYLKTITEETTAAQTTAVETTSAQTTAEETTAAQTTAEETTAAQTTAEETTPAQTTAVETTKSVTTDIKTIADTTTKETTKNAVTNDDTSSVTAPNTSNKNISGFFIGIVLLAGISVIGIYKSKKNN